MDTRLSRILRSIAEHGTTWYHRLACRLGLHDWKLAGVPLQIPGTYTFIAPHACKHCPIVMVLRV